ncbi:MULTISPECIES: hypothetical protein [unclassified Pseudoclavibacter]|uniref:hypothetical protein n=1 Tax=unclassified Pseudoclavibacter TaxID=2615177 RepID=UPI001BA86524|nr:hypothetical protein [Pseudoclavibacter sp. Marseille-Q4354]MBS3177373.1 hypothetical protein [Pseudoclavibacter sp. Marseille-Q4354]
MGLAFVRYRIRYPGTAARETRTVGAPCAHPVLVVASEVEGLPVVVVIAVAITTLGALALEAFPHRTQVGNRLRLIVCGRTLAGAVIVALRVARL